MFKIPIDIKCYDKNYGSITKFDIIKNQMPLLQENQMPSSKKNNIIFIVDPNGVFFGN